MSGDPILPPGVRVGSGRSEHDNPVVTLNIGGLTAPAAGRSWPEGNAAAPVNIAVVITPRQARALGALLLKQADLAEAAERARGPILRVLP